MIGLSAQALYRADVVTVYLSALRDSAIVLVVSLEGPTDRGVRLRQADRQSIRQASRRSGRRLEFSEKSQGIF